MAAHCFDRVSYPTSGHLSNIDLEAAVKPCKLGPGVTATHTTTIDNQRTGDVHKIQISVKHKYNGVVLNGDSSLTEHILNIPMLRSGNSHSKGFQITRNPHNVIPNDEIETSITLYDSTQVSGSTYGTPESTSLRFTVDIS